MSEKPPEVVVLHWSPEARRFFADPPHLCAGDMPHEHHKYLRADKVEALVEAVEGAAYVINGKLCWCGISPDDDDHSVACEEIRTALAAVKGETDA